MTKSKDKTEMPDFGKSEMRPGRAVAVPLKGGGHIMFSCTAELADEMEDRLGLKMEK